MEFVFRLLPMVALVSVCYSFRVRRDFSCGGPTSHFTAPNGTIYSHVGFTQGHNYGKNLHCTWVIEAQPGWHVELTSNNFDVESTSNCYRDYLSLFDGPTNRSAALGKYCGTTFGPVTSTGRFLTLQFVSNSYTTKAGFELHYNWTHSTIHSCPGTQWLCGNNRCIPSNYRCDGDDDCADDTDEHNCPPKTCSTRSYFPCTHGRQCIRPSFLCDGGNDCSDGSDEIKANCNGGSSFTCGTLNYTGASGIIQSPGYPVTYPNRLSCKYHIYAPNGTHNVVISFAGTFNIENDVACAYDYVSVMGPGGSNKHGPYCGKSAPSTSITIPGSHAVIEFHSDTSDGYEGFKLTYTAH